MAHGPDTDRLLSRLEASALTGFLAVDDLDITSIPFLPANLLEFRCSNTQLTTLPPLPASLQKLVCQNSQIRELPALPHTLRELHCSKTPLIRLPLLPATLKILNVSSTYIKILPEIPLGLWEVWTYFTPLKYRKQQSETWRDYSLRCLDEEASAQRANERSRILLEELVASVWHPRRVEKLLEIGGFELLEAL